VRSSVGTSIQYAPPSLPFNGTAVSAAVGIADDGAVTVAYDNTRLARAAWGAPPVMVQIPTGTLPANSHIDDLVLAVTGAGRAVIALHASVDPPTPIQETVSISIWNPVAAAPSPPTGVFRGYDGQLVEVATHDTAYVVWRAQVQQDPTTVTGIGAATVTDDGTIHHSFGIPGHGGAGSFQSRRPAIAPAGNGARVYTNVGGAIHTTRIAPSAMLSNTTIVTRSGEANPHVFAAEADGRPIIAWTHYLNGTRSATRARIARPR
jgi:hypothetical protein